MAVDTLILGCLQALTGSFDGAIAVWDLQPRRTTVARHVRTMRPDTTGRVRRVRSIQAYDRSTRALSSCDDGSLKVWCLQSFKVLATLFVGSTPRPSATFPQSLDCSMLDHGRAIAAGSDGVVTIWELESHACVQTLSITPPGVEGAVFAICPYAGGSCAMSGSTAGLFVLEPDFAHQ